ncbi:MAG TPA: MBL fold metallo-hydrolase [Nitrososphaerales archaeon]|nr:MBL fold metallo-hydrolase [Nitrososphaerales archaeon]
MVEIQKGVHQVDGVNANCYIIQGSDGSLILIDSGMSKEGKKILEYIQGNLSKKLSELNTIVLTHAHPDHIRGALEIKNATGARVMIHDMDADYLSGQKKLPTPKGMVGFLFRLIAPFIRSPSFESDSRLKESDRIGSSLVVMHTPGHTPGSISLYDENKKLMFVGDAIISGKKGLEGPPRQFTLDYLQAIDSIEKISSVEFSLLLSGHGRILKATGSEDVKRLALALKNEFH